MSPPREPAPYVVAVDVGGTSVKALLVARDGTVQARARRPTERALGPAAVVARVLSFVDDLVGEGTRRFGRMPEAVGVAVLGMVDEARGVAVRSAAVGWRDVPLRDLLVARITAPVVVAHDLRSAAVAELRVGAARGHPEVLLVAIGTGVGAAVVVGGEILVGAHGRAGEIGHLRVRPDGPPCGCGGRGCLETLASGAAIARAYATRAGREAGAAEVVALAESGDAVAREVWAEAVDALAGGIVAAQALLDPGLVVLGGGLALAGERLLAPLRRAIADHGTLPGPPEVVLSTLGDEAASRGAGMLAWDLVGHEPT